MKKLFILVLSFIGSIYAEDVNLPISQINRGFIENPPTELTKKFPMCDAFLKVDWINKENKIGYASYDIYKKGAKIGMRVSLVSMQEEHYTLGWDVNIFKKNKKLNELFEQIKQPKRDKDGVLIIQYNGKRIYLSGHDFETNLSNHQLNVCVVHPTNGRAWIVEGTNNDTYPPDMESALEILRKNFNNNDFQPYFIAIDINNDGQNDYISPYYGFYYSAKNHYYDLQRVRLIHDFKKPRTDEELMFASNGKKCILLLGNWHITTDGNDYFLNDICNITKLTQGEK